MKLTSQITRGALACAFTLSLAGMASAEEYKDGIVFCKVRLTDMPNPDDAYLSVTLPATPGWSYYEHDITVWDLGTVACGGVYDSFYNGGPGYFRVQNTGNYPAYVYVSTGGESRQAATGFGEARHVVQDIFDDAEPLWLVPSQKFLRGDAGGGYALAVTTDVTSIVPKWNPLSWGYGQNCNNSSDVRFLDFSKAEFDGCYLINGVSFFHNDDNGDFSAFLAEMPVGEMQLFDLKFWAPPYSWGWDGDFFFIVRVMASAFPLWNHER